VRYSDIETRETFWGDFDQRHALAISGIYRPSERTTVGLTFRAGSSVPLPGYFAQRDGELFVGDHRNQVRLRDYSRLDLRASRRFTSLGRRMTAFVELLNVLNRTNVGAANGVVEPDTGRAVGFTEPLIQRLPSVGILVEF
jgi:hypothetical protein